MSVRPRKRFSPARFLAPLATLMIMGYFAFHAFHGQYGIRADIVMKSEISHLEQVLLERTSHRSDLEHRVELIMGDSSKPESERILERDMVDEQIRRQLNMMRDDEVTIWFTPESALGSTSGDTSN